MNTRIPAGLQRSTMTEQGGTPAVHQQHLGRVGQGCNKQPKAKAAQEQLP